MRSNGFGASFAGVSLDDERLVDERRRVAQHEQARAHGRRRLAAGRVRVADEHHVGAAQVRREIARRADAARRVVLLVHLGRVDRLGVDELGHAVVHERERRTLTTSVRCVLPRCEKPALAAWIGPSGAISTSGFAIGRHRYHGSPSARPRSPGACNAHARRPTR